MTASDVLNRARAEIGAPGSVENPLGSNSGTKYHAWYGGVQGYQWCAIFQSWLFWDFLHYKSYYTGDWINYGTRNGWMILAPQPGAICVMDRYPYLEQGGISDHVGVIESINGAARTMTLVEGNYNDRVARVTRPIDGSTKYYFILPPYRATPEKPKRKQPQEEDMELVEVGKPKRFPAYNDGGYANCGFDLTDESPDGKGAKVKLFFRRNDGDKGYASQDFAKLWTFDLLPEGSRYINVRTDLKVQGSITLKVEVLSGGPVGVTRRQEL